MPLGQAEEDGNYVFFFRYRPREVHGPSMNKDEVLEPFYAPPGLPHPTRRRHVSRRALQSISIGLHRAGIRRSCTFTLGEADQLLQAIREDSNCSTRRRRYIRMGQHVECRSALSVGSLQQRRFILLRRLRVASIPCVLRCMFFIHRGCCWNPDWLVQSCGPNGQDLILGMQQKAGDAEWFPVALDAISRNSEVYRQ